MLLSLDDIQSFKSLSSSINEAKALLPFVQEAEEFDIVPFLGQELFNALKTDFEASPSLATYADLFNGSTYTYSDRSYTHQGIKAVLAYYSYARYVANSNTVSTKYGLVVKENEFSSPVSEKTLARRISQAQSGAAVYQERVRLYLIHHVDDFPLWHGSRARKKGQVRLTSIGGNSSRIGRTYNNCSGSGSSSNDCGDDYVDSGYVE